MILCTKQLQRKRSASVSCRLSLPITFSVNSVDPFAHFWAQIDFITLACSFGKRKGWQGNNCVPEQTLEESFSLPSTTQFSPVPLLCFVPAFSPSFLLGTVFSKVVILNSGAKKCFSVIGFPISTTLNTKETLFTRNLEFRIVFLTRFLSKFRWNHALD